MNNLVARAKDALLQAKVDQAHFANKTWGQENTYTVGDLVVLLTLHWRSDYQKKGELCGAKFSHSSVTFTGYWPGSGHDIIGISNGSVDVANRMTIRLVMGWPTVKFKWPPVGRQWGWWANGAADSGFGGLMGRPTGQVQVITSRPTGGLVG